MLRQRIEECVKNMSVVAARQIYWKYLTILQFKRFSVSTGSKMHSGTEGISNKGGNSCVPVKNTNYIIINDLSYIALHYVWSWSLCYLSYYTNFNFQV